MASFFGEILPVISRAVDDEDEEDVFFEPDIMWKPIKLCKDEEKVETIESLVLAVGCIATGFLESYCLRDDTIRNLGNIFEKVNNSSLGAAENENVLASLFQKDSPHTVVYCTCKVYLAPDHIWYFMEKLFSKVHLDKLKNVIILDSCSISTYLHHSPQSCVPMIRSLCTSSYNKSNLLFPSVVQPNLAKGLSAAVLTHCELKKIPAVLYMCYTDSLTLDIASINAFQPILGKNYLEWDEQIDESADFIQKLIMSHGSLHSIYT